jgi:ribosomal protein S24E
LLRFKLPNTSKVALLIYKEQQRLAKVEEEERLRADDEHQREECRSCQEGQ